MVATVAKSANLNNKSNVNALDNSSVRHSSSPSIHRNSPAQWLALSDDEFKVAILERAKHARNCEERYSWEEVRAYAHSQRVGS